VGQRIHVGRPRLLKLSLEKRSQERMKLKSVIRTGREETEKSRSIDN
jgi:hypothetical protein